MPVSVVLQSTSTCCSMQSPFNPMTHNLHPACVGMNQAFVARCKASVRTSGRFSSKPIAGSHGAANSNIVGWCTSFEMNVMRRWHAPADPAIPSRCESWYASVNWWHAARRIRGVIVVVQDANFGGSCLLPLPVGLRILALCLPCRMMSASQSPGHQSKQLRQAAAASAASKSQCYGSSAF